MTDYTDEQKYAIYTKGSDILVSAAAGSGKTAVLVERIINTVTDKLNPVDIDRLLVVTFTEQAAMEMRFRINRSLNELLRQHPGDINIRKQISLLPKSNITTIHAFCRKIVLEHADNLDLDPKFKIGEIAELQILKQELMEDLLEEEYSKENNEAFTNLVEMYGRRYNDDSLRELIFEIHEFMFTSPWPFKRIDEYVEMYNPSRLKTIDETVWAKLFTDSIRTILDGACFEFQYALEICLMENGPDKYISCLHDDISDVTLLINTLDNGIEAAYPVFGNFEFTVKRLPAYRKTDIVDEKLKDMAQKTRKSARDAVNKVITNYFKKPLPEYLQDLINLYPVLKCLVDVTVKFARYYQIEKHERNMLDFNDLEQFALKALYTEDSDIKNPVLSVAAYDIQARFDEILTDEYQDSNYIQELILSAVSKNAAHNRFMVGDIKQSIYRFRQAKPEIFIDKYKKYAQYKNNSQAARVKINLYKNFRSRENILSAINFLFCQLMSTEVGEIDYDENAALYYGAKYLETDKNAEDGVEICLLQKDALNDESDEDNEDNENNENYEEDEVEDLTKAEMEAEYIAKRIKEFVSPESMRYVRNDSGDGYRSTRFSDIVILAGSVKNIAETFNEVFKKHDIPLYVNTSGGYFKTLEVVTMLGVLQTIDNPKQDIHLISTLHSPIYGFTCDELVEIRAVKEKISFYDCMLEYSNRGENFLLIEKIKSFLTELYEFQRLAVFTPISELLWIIYDKTNYFEYAGAMHGGSVRKANLRALIERAVSYENTRLKGMFHFLKYVERLQVSKTDLSEAKTVTQNEDVVRLMTIHSSKGLEFPIVFVSMLGTKFNMADRKKSILLDTDFGFGPDFIDLKYRVKYNTISRTALMQKSLNEELSEKLRVLYVALTRAKEKLILTGVIDNYEKKSQKWLRLSTVKDIRLPKHYMIKASNFLDWIMPVMLRKEKLSLPYGDCIFSFKVLKAETTSIKTDFNAEAPNQLYEKEQNQKQIFKYVEEKLNWQYPYKIAEILPSKISVSEIKRLHYTTMSGTGSEQYFLEDLNFNMPEFLSGETQRKASDIGTAVHTCMEHIDFNLHTSETEINDLIHSLTEKNLINKADAELIPIKRIAAFLSSNLAERIRKSPLVKRETPFVIALKPKDIYYDETYKNADENILLHGIIDLFFEEDGYLVLVDYKSDYIPDGGLSKIIEKYTPQLKVYKKALNATNPLPVKEVYLYLFSKNEPVLCEI